MKCCTVLSLGLLLSTLLTAAQPQGSEAERLFRNMEKKIKGAKALEVVFTYQLEGKTTKGSLLLTNDNKARLQVSGPFHFRVARNASFLLISDGERSRLKGARYVSASNGQIGVKLGGEMEWKNTKYFHSVLAATVSRGGMGLAVLGLPYAFGGDRDPDDGESKMTVRDFKAGVAEMVDGRQAKVVSYRYGKGGNDDPKVTVWIDAETSLPLKRTILVHPESERNHIAESYSEFKLNPRVDAKAFDFPK